MVDMRVGQHHRIDLARIEAEGPGVQPFQRARSLEQAAIDQHPRVAAGKFVAGPCHGARRAVEAQFQKESLGAAAA